MNRDQLREGMTVYSSDGEKLGKIVELGATQFQVEKGFFFPKDTILSYDEISDLRGSDVIVSHGKDVLTSRYGGYGAASAGERRSDEDVRVSLAEEELDVIKREKSAGEVRVGKHVESETKTIDVPVRKEHVTVERTAATSSTPAEGAFKDETISVPIVEEEIEVRKRPVVKEEIRVRKQVTEQERRVADTVRREEADIEDTTDNRGGGTGYGSDYDDPLTRK